MAGALWAVANETNLGMAVPAAVDADMPGRVVVATFMSSVWLSSSQPGFESSLHPASVASQVLYMHHLLQSAATSSSCCTCKHMVVQLGRANRLLARS